MSFAYSLSGDHRAGPFASLPAFLRKPASRASEGHPSLLSYHMSCNRNTSHPRTQRAWAEPPDWEGSSEERE